MKTIKKILVALIAITFFAGSANAKIVNFGIKAGMNVNKINIDNGIKGLINPSNSYGWEAGVMAEFNVPVVGLCLDASLMYARMNNSTTVGVPGGTIDGKVFGQNFIQIPINVKYKFQIPMVSQIFAPYIFTGPEFAFKLDNVKWNDEGTKPCQVAWNIGLGLQFINHLQIGASYGFGINNIAQGFGFNAQDLKAHNNYWTITAAWLF